MIIKKPQSLAPYISDKLLDLHYDKHHMGYLNALKGQFTTLPNSSLQELLNFYREGSIFNNLAQIWNHNFFWQSMTINSNSNTAKVWVNNEIYKSYNMDFNSAITKRANLLFGSGWCWLVYKDGLEIQITFNALLPTGLPLLVIDLWEHAYYVDYYNKRADFIQVYLENLINWDFVQNNLLKYNLL